MKWQRRKLACCLAVFLLVAFLCVLRLDGGVERVESTWATLKGLEPVKETFFSGYPKDYESEIILIGDSKRESATFRYRRALYCVNGNLQHIRNKLRAEVPYPFEDVK